MTTPHQARQLLLYLQEVEDGVIRHALDLPPPPQGNPAEGNLITAQELNDYWRLASSRLTEWAYLVIEDLPQ